ncbi:MAG TPA: hypothetical protein VES97_04905, partial [Solirubrobacteraceae bacterium]|nr:hypothetical protein [Solirubrobacteraceae bacterium]
DPTNPACAASGEGKLPESQSPSDPCQGPFPSNGPGGLWDGGVGDVVPQLSRDGYVVAFLSEATPLALGEDFGKAGNEERNSDVYVVDMRESREGRALSRTGALSVLSELSSGKETDIATNGPIVDLAISPDGSQVAFTTQRTVFSLSSLTDVSVPDPEAGLAELFDIDLANHTLTRVTGGFEGGPREHPHEQSLPGKDPYRRSDGALSPAFSGDGDTLAFSSTASNLLYGDGNTPARGSAETPGLDGGDVFVVSRAIPGSAPSPQYISGAPAEPSLSPSWTLGATALSRRDGTVLLDVQLPGAGTVRADAQSPVRIQSVAPARAAHGAARRRRMRTTVALRAVAAATRAIGSSGDGLVTLTLTLSPRYRALAARPGGLSAAVNVVFTAPGHPTLRQSVPVTFIRARPPARSSKRRVASAGHRP